MEGGKQCSEPNDCQPPDCSNLKALRALLPQSGGKLIDQGSYGCVFDPPLLCKQNTGIKLIKSTSELGKLTETGDAIREIKMAGILRNRPLTENYFILPEGPLCSIIPEEAEKYEDDFKNCNALQRIGISAMRQFTMRHGGKNLHKSLTRTFDFLGFCKHLLEAGTMLNLAGVVHNDIHIGNILIDPLGVPRLIDWGLSFEGKTITIENIDWKSFKNQKNTEAPEITLATLLKHNNSIEESVDIIIDNKPIVKELRKNFREELEEFTNMSSSLNNKEWDKIFLNHWSKFDSWAIGCIIFEIFTYLKQFPEFIENVYQPNKVRINKLIDGTLDMNAFTRFDCVEALSVFQPDNNVLEIFAKDWLITQRKTRTVIESRAA